MRYALWLILLVAAVAAFGLLVPRLSRAPGPERWGGAPESVLAGDYRCGDGTEFSLVATTSGFELLPATSVEHVPRAVLAPTAQGVYAGSGVVANQTPEGLALRAPSVDTTCHRFGPAR